MRYLFIHQNFPGQYLHLLRHLVKDGEHQILFITNPNDNQLKGVEKITYQSGKKSTSGIQSDTIDIENALIRAETVAKVCTFLKQKGFQPDIIIGHHGWGELLNIGDVFPDVPVLGYFEFYYHTKGTDVNFDPEFPTSVEHFARIRTRNTVNFLAWQTKSFGQTPTQWQYNTYPRWLQEQIRILPEGVDLNACIPNPNIHLSHFDIQGVKIQPSERLITYVARDLEPYRGFHVFMRALPRILEKRKDVHAILVGGDGVSYGSRLKDMSWKEYYLRQIGSSLDLERIHFVGRIPYQDHIKILQRSNAHVYLTYPFVASWSLREALACGCKIIASNTEPVIEFIQNRKNGLLTPFFDHQKLSECVLEILEDDEQGKNFSQNARFFAEKELSMPLYIERYRSLISNLITGINQ